MDRESGPRGAIPDRLAHNVCQPGLTRASMRKTRGSLTPVDHDGSHAETRAASHRPVIGPPWNVVIGVTAKRVIGITGMHRARGGFVLFAPSHSPSPGFAA